MTQHRMLRMAFSAALCAIVPAIACAEDVTVTTYYPSPRGVYDELRTTGQVEIGSLAPMGNPAEKLKIVGNGAATNLVIDNSAWQAGNWVSLGANVPTRVDLTLGDVDLNINFNGAGDVATSTFINGGTGDVGIGIDPSTAPSAKLHVVSADAGLDPLRVDTAAETNSLLVRSNGSVVIGRGGLTILDNPAGAVELDVRGGIRVKAGVPVCGILDPNQGGYAFQDATQPDTGMFSSGDGEVALYANCGPALYIHGHPPQRMTTDPWYPVGIGFQSTDPVPVERLEVKNGNLQIDDGVLRIQPGAHGKKIDLWGGGDSYAIGSQPYGLFLTTDVGFSFFRNTVYTSGVGNPALYIDVNGGSLGGGVTHIHDDLRVYGNAAVSGTLGVTGKISAPGGVDPPYVSFTEETHASIRRQAKDVAEHEKVMLFWNSTAHRMEIYVIGEDRFYTMTGDPVEEHP